MKYTKVLNWSPNTGKLFGNIISYNKIEMSDSQEKTTAHDIFTLPGYALPSQYRTLLPAPDLEIERLMKLDRRKRLIRNVTLTLIALIVIFIVIIIALIIVLQLSLPEKRGHLQLTAVHVNRTRFHVDEIRLLKSKAMVKAPKQANTTKESTAPKDGVRCISKCWEYAAFKFRSQCVDGYCICKDKNYDDTTCLPKTGGCSIRRHEYHPWFHPRRTGQRQTSYSCIPEKKSPAVSVRQRPEVHVISMYGNKRVQSTSLHFKSSRKTNATLILVSYEPLVWNVTLDENVSTDKIVLVSHYAVSRTKVKVTKDDKSTLMPSSLWNSVNSTSHFQSKTHFTSSNSSGVGSNSNSTSLYGNTSTSNFVALNEEESTLLESTSASVSPSIKITRMMLHTGYGEDKESGNTPSLLDQITKRVGPISTFFGVAYADEISFDMGEGRYDIDHFQHEKVLYKIDNRS